MILGFPGQLAAELRTTVPRGAPLTRRPPSGQTRPLPGAPPVRVVLAVSVKNLRSAVCVRCTAGDCGQKMMFTARMIVSQNSIVSSPYHSESLHERAQNLVFSVYIVSSIQSTFNILSSFVHMHNMVFAYGICSIPVFSSSLTLNMLLQKYRLLLL